MKNLIFQYYIPYEMNDKDMGGVEMPEWAKAGSRSAQAYAKHCGAEYLLDHERYFQELDPMRTGYVASWEIEMNLYWL